jgi:hypothetical protein
MIQVPKGRLNLKQLQPSLQDSLEYILAFPAINCRAILACPSRTKSGYYFLTHYRFVAELNHE